MPPSDDTLATDADREHVVSALRDAYAVGALGLDDFGARIERTLVARTAGDLALVSADLPAAPPRREVGRLRRAVAVLRAKTVRLQRGEQISAGPAAVLGACTVDLRDAWIAPSPDRVAVLSVLAVLGRIRLVVPPGVTVAVSGGPVLHVSRAGPNAAPDGLPVLRVRAGALFGSVKVITA